MDYIKIKTFSSSQNTIKRVKMEVTEWENIFARNLTINKRTCDLHMYTHTLLQINRKHVANPIDK